MRGRTCHTGLGLGCPRDVLPAPSKESLRKSEVETAMAWTMATNHLGGMSVPYRYEIPVHPGKSFSGLR